jgi:tetratricopeptide (TPR) repeat protein
MGFLNKILELSKSKGRNNNRTAQTEDLDKGFDYQTKGIEAYKNKQFKESKTYLLKAMDYGFYSPGGVTYLAKIYRKEKDYQSEVMILEKSIRVMKKDTENNYGKNLEKLEERLENARDYQRKSG